MLQGEAAPDMAAGRTLSFTQCRLFSAMLDGCYQLCHADYVQNCSVNQGNRVSLLSLHGTGCCQLWSQSRQCLIVLALAWYCVMADSMGRAEFNHAAHAGSQRRAR